MRFYEHRKSSRLSAAVIAARRQKSKDHRKRGPKGRVEIHIEQWICSECGSEHERDANAAIMLRKSGTASGELTRADMVPLLACTSLPASAVVEPRTETERTSASFRKAGAHPCCHDAIFSPPPSPPGPV